MGMKQVVTQGKSAVAIHLIRELMKQDMNFVFYDPREFPVEMPEENRLAERSAVDPMACFSIVAELHVWNWFKHSQRS